MPKGTGRNLAGLIDEEIKKLQEQITALEKMKSDYARITGAEPAAAPAKAKPKKAAGKGRGKRGPMSEEARAKLSAIAKKRWAAAKQSGVKSLKAASKKPARKSKKAA